MNFIQTLYIEPSKHPFKDNFGWLKPEYHLMSWALSSLQLQKVYGNVELYANSIAADYLVDMLRLPYSRVHTTHDDLKLADVNLWALPKIYTYSLQDKPFLHIDGDVFLFDRFADTLLQSPLIAQNIEVATEYYTSTQKQLMDNFSYLPPSVKADFYSNIPINAVNAGILGGNNIQFIKQYAAEAFEYVNKNVNELQNISVNSFNVFFEQHLFYSLAKKQNVPISFFVNEIIKDNMYMHFGDFHEVPFRRSYLHLLGELKRDEFTCLQMAAKLRELYPDYYYRIIALCKKNDVSLFTNFYSNKHIETKNDYQQLINKSTDSFENDISTDDTEQINVEYNLSFLNILLDYYSSIPNAPFNTNNFKDDCISFSEKLMLVLEANTSLSEYYLYGRDLKSVEWYSQIFADMSILKYIRLVQTKGVSIIESSFNWAGLLNKHYRVGVKYYERLTVSEGVFFNLVVPQTIGSKFLLHDIDELAKTVIELLSEPTSINNLMTTMQQYFEDDVIQNHYDVYKKLIEKIIKQLVLLKTIQPYIAREKDEYKLLT